MQIGYEMISNAHVRQQTVPLQQKEKIKTKLY